MSDDNAKKPDYTSPEAYISGEGRKRATVDNIPWDQPATLIDLEGRVPVLAEVRECVVHFTLYKPHAKANARLLLTSPVHRAGRVTRTWLLEPAELSALAERLKREAN
jgi:hypothetical protein